MWDWLFNTLWGWWGVTGLIVIGAGVIAFLIPQLRGPMIGLIGAALAITAAYSKGRRDQLERERQRKERVIKRKQEEYHAVDKRPDTDKTVEDRLRDGTF